MLQTVRILETNICDEFLRVSSYFNWMMSNFPLWVTVVLLRCQCHMNVCACVSVCVSIWYDIANNETYRLLGDATATW